MWITAENKETLEDLLFRFLLSVRDGNSPPLKPIVASAATLREAYSNTHPELSEALRHCLDQFLVEISHDPAHWGGLEVPGWSLGVAVALNNCLIQSAQREAAEDYTSALIATLPPARHMPEALIYHAILRGSINFSPRGKIKISGNEHALIERSPLTALWSLDKHTPVNLSGLAKELLPGWRARDIFAAQVWQNNDEWLNTVSSLLADQRIARWVRWHWLQMPESREACRNIGLLLEALRRREDHRAFILEFYEAYDYFRSETVNDEWRGQMRDWPLLRNILNILLISGESEAAINVNRRGNEYFQKFRPLIETIIAEGALPRDYKLLTLRFVHALRPLLPYVTQGTRPALSFGDVIFEE